MPDDDPRHVTRRWVLAVGGLAGLGALALGRSMIRSDPASLSARARVPLDSVPHERCWMAWPASTAIWGGLLGGIQEDIATIARTIARFEPVTVCANLQDIAQARAMCGDRVEVIGDVPVDDCWMRDSGPVFTIGPHGKLGAIGLNFNGWGDRQIHPNDASVAKRIAAYLGIPFTVAAVVSEGGAIETDGDGTLLATRSSIINVNRNPGVTAIEIETAILAAFGASSVLWVPGLRDRDITDDHIDATSRFVAPGQLLVQTPPRSRTDVWADDARGQLAILTTASDARGRPIEIATVRGPRSVRSTKRAFLDSYVNYYATNDALITAQFGDAERDAEARDTLAFAFPGRLVVQLDVDRLHEGGGGIHCVTQQEPRVAPIGG